MAIHLKSVGAIIFRRQENKILYLLLYRRPHNHFHESWDFPKGLVNLKEDELTTAQREIKEETGIKNFNFLPGFREKIKYFFRQEEQLVLKEVVFYLAETKTKKIKISSEHDDYKWLEYQEAKKKIPYKNTKKILEKANNFLMEWTKKERLLK